MNIAEILRHCPKGTKLYTPIYGNVVLDRVLLENGKFPILIKDATGCEHLFTENGCHRYNLPNVECVLFPSKDQRNWSRFRLPLKAGDIVMTIDGETPFIFKEYIASRYAHCYCGIDANGTFKMEAPVDVYWTSDFIIPASEEAKKELFDKIEEAGYKWNADTLELEEVVPKFKNKFKPFDKVLVRNHTDEKWTIDLFSYYDEKDKGFPFICINDFYRYCIPYEGNEHLVGKTN